MFELLAIALRTARMRVVQIGLLRVLENVLRCELLHRLDVLPN
jgi:hypothetical protein